MTLPEHVKQKEAYSSPRLERYGDLRELTRSLNSTATANTDNASSSGHRTH